MQRDGFLPPNSNGKPEGRGTGTAEHRSRTAELWGMEGSPAGPPAQPAEQLPSSGTGRKPGLSDTMPAYEQSNKQQREEDPKEQNSGP